VAAELERCDVINYARENGLRWMARPYLTLQEMLAEVASELVCEVGTLAYIIKSWKIGYFNAAVTQEVRQWLK
jgi:hypothetical protein